MSTFGVCVIMLLLVADAFAWISPKSVPSCGEATHIVRVLSHHHDQAVRNHDIATAASLYHPDVIMMPEGHATFTGSATLKATLVWMKAVHSIEVTLDQVACLDTGKLVIVRKTSKITGSNGNVMFDGKTLQIWKWKGTGANYQIYLEMYNNNS